MSGKTSRTKGHNFEREIRKKLKTIFPKVETSRYSSREMDDLCVDLVDTAPFHFQCKAWKSAPNLHQELKKMPDDILFNVVMHKRPNQGTIVAMTLEDFIEILQMLKSEKII